MLRKEKKDAMARWIVANDATLEQVTRYLCRPLFLYSLDLSLSTDLKFSSFFREETASQKIDLRLRVMARVAEHKAVRSVFTFHSISTLGGVKVSQLCDSGQCWKRSE